MQQISKESCWQWWWGESNSDHVRSNKTVKLTRWRLRSTSRLASMNISECNTFNLLIYQNSNFIFHSYFKAIVSRPDTSACTVLSKKDKRTCENSSSSSKSCLSSKITAVLWAEDLFANLLTNHPSKLFICGSLTLIFSCSRVWGNIMFHQKQRENVLECGHRHVLVFIM